jgi:hypothetical protein
MPIGFFLTALQYIAIIGVDPSKRSEATDV